MFEKIILRRSDKGPAITVGEIAEALLFYKNVHILLDWGSLGYLVQKIGMATFLSLLSRPNVSSVHCKEKLGTKTESRGSINRHSFVSVVLEGNIDGKQLPNRKKRLEYLLSKQGLKKKDTKRFIERFCQHVPNRSLVGDYFVKGGVLKSATDDIFDKDFIFESIRRILLQRLGSELLPSDLTFKIHPFRNSFYIETNLNFESINRELKRCNPHLGEITESSLVNAILDAKADMVLASHYGGDFYTSELTSEIIRVKHRELLKKIGVEKQEIKEFSQIVIQNSPSVREAINSGERTFDEFLSLLDKSQKFREWAQGVNPDEKLVSSYLRDVTAESWINKLPGKVLRYFVGSAIGIFNPVLGLSLSAADSLLLDKIMNRWRPNHFVQHNLLPFINKTEL